MLDSNSLISARLENIVQTDGKNGFFLYARNYDTSGNQKAQKGLKLMIDKSGTGTWSVDEAASFRSAIGASGLIVRENASTSIITSEISLPLVSAGSGNYAFGGTVYNNLTIGTSTSNNNFTVHGATTLNGNVSVNGALCNGMTQASYTYKGAATCSTSGSSTTRTASITGYTLSSNSFVKITFTYAVPANASLNITSKGAKPIYKLGRAIKAGEIGAGSTVGLLYDGTRYNVITATGSYTSGTSYVGYFDGRYGYIGTQLMLASQMFGTALSVDTAVIRNVNVTGSMSVDGTVRYNQFEVTEQITANGGILSNGELQMNGDILMGSNYIYFDDEEDVYLYYDGSNLVFQNGSTHKIIA